MTSILLLMLLAPAPETERDRAAAALIAGISQRGQVLDIGGRPSERVSPDARIAPGPPPLLAFRYLEGKQRHRFGKLDLVMDDAGH